MKKFFPALAAFLLITVTGIFAQKKAIDLKFNLPKGAGYDYNMNMDITTKMNANGQDVNVNNSMGVGYHFEVIGDSAGWKKIASTVSKIVMNINAGGMMINYDSDKPLDTSDVMGSVLGKILGAMKGGQFTFTMNEKGDIGSVTGIDEMINNMMAAAPQSGNMGAGLGSAFDEENFKQNLKQAFGAYPGKPIKPGDTWTTTTTTNNGGMDLQMNNTYTLESVESNIANIKVNSKLSSSSEEVEGLNGTMTGAIKYDIPTGVPVDGDLDMGMKMNASNEGQSIPVDTHIKMKITGKKG